MTDWTRQVTEFQRSWMEQQQKFLSDWLGALQGTGAARANNTWEQSVSMVEQQVNSTLEMQKQSLMAMAGTLENVEGAPETYTNWIHQLEQGLDMWTDMQHRLWDVWFKMLHSMEPAAQSSGKSPIADWQEMAERAVSMQQQWLSDLTSASTAAAGAGRSTGKSSTSKKSSTGNGKSGGQKTS